jgi:hypothetical protein
MFQDTILHGAGVDQLTPRGTDPGVIESQRQHDRARAALVDLKLRVVLPVTNLTEPIMIG